jgi:hypothetical protein
MNPQTLLAAIPTAWVPYVTFAITVGAALGACLPPPKQPVSGWYPAVYGIANWLGFNFGHARNATAPVTAP